MNMFESKKIDRKIGPKFGDEDNNGVINQFKPKLYEDQINFDRMRMYRLNRVREQLKKNNIGACILLTGCFQSSASLIGPVYTLGSSGNIYQAGLTY